MAVLMHEGSVNNNPADVGTLVAVDEFGVDLRVPSECFGCERLTWRGAAYARGLARAGGEDSGPCSFYPIGKEAEVEAELVERSDDAIKGTCRFISQTLGCWRREV